MGLELLEPATGYDADGMSSARRTSNRATVGSMADFDGASVSSRSKAASWISSRPVLALGTRFRRSSPLDVRSSCHVISASGSRRIRLGGPALWRLPVGAGCAAESVGQPVDGPEHGAVSGDRSTSVAGRYPQRASWWHGQRLAAAVHRGDLPGDHQQDLRPGVASTGPVNGHVPGDLVRSLPPVTRDATDKRLSGPMFCLYLRIQTTNARVHPSDA